MLFKQVRSVIPLQPQSYLKSIFLKEGVGFVDVKIPQESEFNYLYVTIKHLSCTDWFRLLFFWC